ncbi:MAG: chalcone isomerase family protein [Elusimicrobiales bacterium]|nr:chalcone isomerase family protein [Elusimicrobiales bacterium]
MIKTTALFLSALLCAVFAQAPSGKTVKGAAFPGVISRGGKALLLNGAGVRTKVVFKVYAAGLYVEKRSGDAEELISSVQDKVMELAFLRSVDGPAVAEAMEQGFRKNSEESLPSLKERLAKFRPLIPDLKKGDRILFAYSAGKSVSVEVNGQKRGEIEGKDFADALFRCWLGKAPADKELKKGLLGE